MLTSEELEASVRELSKFPYLQHPYRSRNWGSKFHFLISYQSKLKPSIAYYLSRLFSKREDLIFEPFSGAGTIPFELGKVGRKTVSLDINEIAFFATYAKMNPIQYDVVLRQIDSLNNHLRNHSVPEDLEDYPDDYIRKFYHEKTLDEILLAIDFFRHHKSMKYSLIKTSILHILHGNRPYALSRRSHNVTPYAPRGEFVYRSLIKSLREKIDRIFQEGWTNGFQSGKVLLDSILRFNKYTNHFDAIITSPPFTNSTRFLYNNRIRLWFLGQSYHEQMKRANDFIDNNEINIFDKVLSQFNRVLRQNSICVMHLGVVKELNMAEKISDMASKKGFSTISIINEDVSNHEKFGIRDQGATHTHQFLILKKEDSLFYF